MTLPPLGLGLMTIASWISTFLLVRIALEKPRIGALIERALIAVVISLFGTLCVAIVWNTDSGQFLFTLEAARIVFRVALAFVLGVPILWLWLYLTGRLGAA